MYNPLRAIFVTLCLGAAVAVDTVVDVDYSQYEGTALSNGITQWLGVRFAAPPLGPLRFTAPQDPVPTEGIQTADVQGPICLGTGESLPANESSEDCLYLSVYAPSNATPASNLPVYVFIQGGGFNTDSNPNINGSGIIESGDMGLIFVTFNYRVGPYGFLSGEEITSRASNNNGLKDQRKVLEWVQKYISRFGGNPDHVVIHGASAGGASVTLQLAAYNGTNKGLFHGTIATAQSFGTVRTITESQYQYDNLVIRTNCVNSNDTLTCLRSLNATFLQSQNINTPSGGAPDAPLYMYSPVLDNDLLTDYTLTAFSKGNFIHLPAIYGDATNEGTIFAPRNTSNISESDTFVKDQWPTVTLPQLATLNNLYPKAEQFNNSGAYWRQLSNAYGELRYICPGIYISGLYDPQCTETPVWNYHWDVKDPVAEADGTGVSHTVEINAVFGTDNVQGSPPESYAKGGINYATGLKIQKYVANFVRTLDPGAVDGVEWEQFGVGAKAANGQRILFETQGVSMEDVPDDQAERCDTIGPFRTILKQ